MKTVPRSASSRVLTSSIARLAPFLLIPCGAFADTFWVGGVSTDWNNPANWSAGFPNGNAFVNTSTGNIATVSATPTANPVDIFIGNGGGNTGQLNHTAGTLSSGGGNWTFIGQGGSTGIYNLTSTTPTGGNLTGLGTGSGSFNTTRIYVGGNGGNGNGTMNINTTGTVTVANDMYVGLTSTGTVKMDSGTINRTGGWLSIGQGGGNGAFNMSGGTVTGANETVVGMDGGSIGNLRISGGTFGVGTQLQIGRNGGSGTVSIANTATTGGTLTGFGLGTASMTVGTRVYIGGTANGTNQLGTGVMNVNTTGTIAIASDLALGAGGGTGTLKFDAGTMTTGGWNFIGKDENGSNGSGTVSISGGLLNAGGGRTYVGQGNSVGHLNVSGGEYRNTGDWMAIGAGNLSNLALSTMDISGTGLVRANQLTVGGAPDSSGKASATVTGGGSLQTAGELWIGQGGGSQGSLVVSSGTVSVGNWLAVGRGGGSGTLTINGTGLVEKTNTNGALTIGAGTSSGTVNLDGGTLKVNQVLGEGFTSGSQTFNFNGGTLMATVNQAAYMQGVQNVWVKAGGAIVDTQAFNITIGQTLNADLVSTGGGFTKLGNGTLTLTSTANNYTGPTTITAGKLSTSILADGGLPSTLGTSSNAATNLVFNGGALQYTGGSSTFDRNFTVNAGKSATFDVTSATTILTLTGGSAPTTGGLTKTGNGALDISGSLMNHTGATNANGGVLSASGTFTSPFVVNAGGHLTGKISDDTGSLASPTLTVPSLTLNTGSAVDFEFSPSATLNADHDIINISNAGGLTLGNTALYLYETFGTNPFATNGTYTLFDYTGTFNGTLNTSFSIANSQVGKVYAMNNNTGNTTIELTIVDAYAATWALDGSGLWGAGSNWTPGTAPNTIGAIATFGSVLTSPNAPATVTVDGGKIVGTIIFDSTEQYILSGSAITLDNGFGTPLINQVQGSHVIAAPLSLTSANTNIAAATGTTLTISGNISGASSGITLTDVGTVVLTGANTYQNTVVNGGNLRIGDGGTTGSLGTGSVVAGIGTTLTFNRSDAVSVGNAISGAGALEHVGAGTLTYTGTASYTGPTVLNAGPFINQGTIAGTSTLDVENATTLRQASTTTVTGLTTVAGTAAASLAVSDTATFTTNGLNVGSGGVGALTISGGTVNGGNVFIASTSDGSLDMSGGTLNANQFVVSNFGGATGVATMSAGKINVGAWTVIGRINGGTGTFTQTGGQFNQNHTDVLNVGENGNGTYTMSGTAILNDPSVVDTSVRGTGKGNIFVGRNAGSVGEWNVLGNAVAHLRTFSVGLNAGSTGTVNIGGAAVVDSSEDFHFGSSGTGVVNLDGGSLTTNTGWVTIGDNAGGNGTLNINAGTMKAQEFLLGGVNGSSGGTGTLNVTGTGVLNANLRVALGESAGGFGFFNASGNSVSNIKDSISVGRNGFGLATISNNASVIITNTLNVGHFGNSQGYVKQTGGAVTSAGGGDWRIGGTDGAAGASVGIYDLTGGTFTVGLNFQIGAFGKGQMNVGGAGSVNVAGGFPVVGRFAGGFGVLDVSTGGTFTDNSGNRLIVGEEGAGVLNVRGGIVTKTGTNTTNAITIGNVATGNGIVNLLAGGVLTTPSIGTATAAANSTLNFNGGTLKASINNATFVQGLTNAYVYAGGGTIDTQSNSVTIAQPLLAASGKGLTGVAITNGGSGYQAAPVVVITNGGGSGATAIATLDGSGQVNGIVITNPGVNYTSAPTVTLFGGAPSTAATLDTPTIADNSSGTITKTGNGTLTLSGPQGYSTLQTQNGRTDLTAALGSGASTINANANLNVSVSQTLAALNIGDGATVTLGTLPPPAPAPEFAESILGADIPVGAAAAISDLAPVAQPVPEPGSVALLLTGVLGMLGLRRRKA